MVFVRFLKYKVRTNIDRWIKLFQFTLSDQSLQDKTEMEYGILLNNFHETMPRRYSEDLRWQAIWMKEIL